MHKIRVAEFKIRTAIVQFRSAKLPYKSALLVFMLLGLGRHIGPPSLAVNTSYFALFSLVV
jgi:hypothetical protein